MTITAKNIGRINVWPTYAIARAADTAECKFVGQLTVWETNDEARANMSHEEECGGGGERPDWVPADAVIHIDLVGGDPQGRAWTLADGEVAVDTLLGSDPNTENGWSTTEYNSSDLTADGLVPSDDPPAMIGSARALMVSNVTSVFVWKQVDTAGVSVFVGSTDGNDGLTVAGDGVTEVEGDVNASTYGTGTLLDATIEDIVNVAPGINGLAMTLTSARLDLACNGSAPTSVVLTETDRPPSNPFTAAVAFQTNPSGCALQSITLYDALPTTAGLSELSEIE
jgi:hypothetical protein